MLRAMDGSARAEAHWQDLRCRYAAADYCRMLSGKSAPRIPEFPGYLVPGMPLALAPSSAGRGMANQDCVI